MGRPTYLPELAEAALRGGCLLGGVRRDVLLLRCMSPLTCRCYGASGEGMAPSALFNGYRWSSPHVAAGAIAGKSRRVILDIGCVRMTGNAARLIHEEDVRRAYLGM